MLMIRTDITEHHITTLLFAETTLPRTPILKQSVTLFVP